MTRLVGLDIGTSSAKGVAIDAAGEVLAQAEHGYPLSVGDRDGFVSSEQDPEDWWIAAQAVLAELDADRADGIGLSGQMHGLVALGADRRPLRPAILWNDGRSQPQCDALVVELGLPRLLELSGNRPLAGFTAPKLRWMSEHEPELHARIRHVLLPKDYVRLRLCGALATDVSDASGTLLLDVGARAWSPELAQALAVDPAWLPAVLESGEVSGHTSAGVPVAAGAGDQAAGALGVGVLEDGGPASVVLGTSGVVLAARDRHSTDPEGRLHAFCHAAPGTWHVMGVMLSAAGALRWLRDATDPSLPFESLTAEAAAWEPGAEGLRFAPYLAGERTPHPDADARGAFVGLSLRHDRGALTRAVLEGVAHGLADSLDLIRGSSAPDRAPTSGRVSGGGARSDLWRQIVAATLDLPLERTAVEAGAAYGAALLGGIAAGTFAGAAEAVDACVRVTDRLEPRGDWVAAYAAQRDGFRALYPALHALQR